MSLVWQGAQHEARPGLGGSLARGKNVPPRLRPSAHPPGSDADEGSGTHTCCDINCVKIAVIKTSGPSVKMGERGAHEGPQLFAPDAARCEEAVRAP